MSGRADLPRVLSTRKQSWLDYGPNASARVPETLSGSLHAIHAYLHNRTSLVMFDSLLVRVFVRVSATTPYLMRTNFRIHKQTTTIGMLTGMIPVTSGRAFVAGRDVTTDMVNIRNSLGVCPQHDILYPDLTVREHLRMYAVLKAVPTSALQETIKVGSCWTGWGEGCRCWRTEGRPPFAAKSRLGAFAPGYCGRRENIPSIGCTTYHHVGFGGLESVSK